MGIFGHPDFRIIKSRILFSQTFPNDRLSKPFILLSEVESTNNYAMAKLQSGLVEPGSCLMAIKQTKGKGQMGKNWESDPGSNITMSTVISLAGSEYHPFILSASVALACVDLAVEAGIRGAQIKWPNDIYINDRKAGGVLIENLVRAGQPIWSVIGTGVNVNQTSFPLVGQPATSFLLEKKTDFDPIELARRLHDHILRRTSAIATLDPAYLLEEYNGLLYRRGQNTRVRQGNIVFETRITSVNAAGELVTTDTMERRFAVGEIVFV